MNEKINNNVNNQEYQASLRKQFAAIPTHLRHLLKFKRSGGAMVGDDPCLWFFAQVDHDDRDRLFLVTVEDMKVLKRSIDQTLQAIEDGTINNLLNKEK